MSYNAVRVRLPKYRQPRSRDLSKDHILREQLGQKAGLFAEQTGNRLAEWIALLDELVTPEIADSRSEGKSVQRAEANMAGERAGSAAASRRTGVTDSRLVKGLKT